MKWTATVVALLTILSGVVATSDAKAEDRVLVSRNETDVDLDSPDLFSASAKGGASGSTKKKPVSSKKELAKELSLDEEPAPAKKKAPEKKPQKVAAPRKPIAPLRKPASVDDVKLDEDDELDEAPVAVAEPVAKKPAAKAKPQSDETVERAIDYALALEKKKEFKKMIEILQPHADALPRHGLTTLARAGKGAGDSMIEIKTLQLSLAKNPNDYVIQTQLGEAYSRTKRSEDSVAAFQAAIASNKRFEPAYEGLWMELERAKEYYEARSVLNDMIKTFGEKPKFYSALCRLYSFDDYLDKATEVCRTAIQKDPKHAENFVHLGVSLRDQEGATEAQKILSGAAKRFPASEPVQATTGSLYLDKKDYAVAYRYYKQATKADPQSTRAWQGLANTAFELQKNDEALEAYGKACDIDRKMTKDLRAAIQKLRARKDLQWEMRYESRLLKCD